MTQFCSFRNQMICSDVDGPRACQRVVSQKEKKTNTIFKHIYTESRKMVLMNLFAGQGETQMQKTGMWAQRGKERVGWIGSAALTYTHCHAYSRQLVGNCYTAESSSLVSCDDPEEWDAGMQQEGDSGKSGYVRHTADSLCCA